MFTYLAIIFVALLLASIFYGFSIVLRRPLSAGEKLTERCTLCRREFEKSLLVERPVGDARLYYFCSQCISSLVTDAAKSTTQLL